MTDIETILELTKDTNKQVNAITSQLGGIEERCKSHQKQLNGHQHTLYGDDGQGGVVKDITNLITCKETINKQTKWWGGVLQDIIKWAVIAFIMFMIFLWKTHSGRQGPDNKQTIKEQ